MRVAQLCDRVEIDTNVDPAIDHASLLGTWVNSNPDTTGVARFVVAEDGGRLSVRTYAVGPDDLIDWGTANVTVFASSASARVAVVLPVVMILALAKLYFRE